MISGETTVGEALSHLEERHLITPEEAASLVKKWQEQKKEAHDPLYLRILSGIGAWFASLFLIIAFGLAQILEHSTSAIVCGLVILAASVALSHYRQTTFFAQLTLALAAAGNILILFGISEMYRLDLVLLVLAQIILCVATYRWLENDIYRFLSPLAAAILAIVWITSDKFHGGFHGLAALEMLLAGGLLLRQSSNERLIPLTYSAATMLPVTTLVFTCLQMNLGEMRFEGTLLPTSLILAAGLIYLIAHLAGSWERMKEPGLLLACIALLALGVFSTPGILVAIGLLILGFAHDDYFLGGLALIFLPVFLFLFYYSLNISLLEKAGMIAGSGVLLLVMRWLVIRRYPIEGGS